MIDISKIDYSALDRPEVLSLLFHPRPEWERSVSSTNIHEILIPVEKNAVIGARFHMVEKSAQNILFFHGNGEIVADYDDLGAMYNKMGINFLPVDYRGYGRSTGKPTITNMMRDCHVIFDFVKKWLKENGYSGFFIIMGRSLGSASAIEIAASYKDKIGGLIIESGFAYAGPLLQLLGINLKAIGFKESESFWNLNKIQAFERPTLIIHAELDHIIPFSDGQALYNASQSPDKTMLKIPGANHNNIFELGFSEYMEAVKNLANKMV
jgi:hypothetical protein